MFFLAILSGALQIGGYLLYLGKVAKRDIDPNPTGWFMFAYGTLTLTILEWDLGANWQLLILPITCAILSVVVASICWRRGTLKWPEHKADSTAFMLDVLLTVLYVMAWALTSFNLVSSDAREISTIVFLVGSNFTTLTAFAPLLRNVFCNPHDEHHLPWLVWSFAYGSLMVLTFLQEGFFSTLMIYPVLNLLLHASMSFLARNKRKFKVI
jgi:hypothetical protein